MFEEKQEVFPYVLQKGKDDLMFTQILDYRKAFNIINMKLNLTTKLLSDSNSRP